ncbi:hypothetical protein P0136_13290 [Lentisphaerota bacterium ZTH]|nr:hypothetical protein JYG24_09195 [Lentisphaerota bacterium]WET06333.1 hypothetical protein P0136_13290 [Lentisphaerota bacterium ZTH]
MSLESLMCIANQNMKLLGFIDKHKNDNRPFKDIINQFKSIHQLPDTHFFYNQYAAIQFFYPFLVFLREKKLEELEIFVKGKSITELNHKWGLKGLVCHKPITELRELLRQLRNAIAHADIKIDEDLTCRMNNNKGDKIIDIKADDLLKFCRALNYYLLTKDETLKDL